MATKIRDIIDYYSGHNVPDEIKERVLDRISNTQDDKEANEAFRELWDKADSAYMEEEEISAAYNRLFETEETREIKRKIASNLQLCQTGCRLRTAADADCIRQALRPD